MDAFMMANVSHDVDEIFLVPALIPSLLDYGYNSQTVCDWGEVWGRNSSNHKLSVKWNTLYHGSSSIAIEFWSNHRRKEIWNQKKQGGEHRHFRGYDDPYASGGGMTKGAEVSLNHGQANHDVTRQWGDSDPIKRDGLGVGDWRKCGGVSNKN